MPAKLQIRSIREQRKNHYTKLFNYYIERRQQWKRSTMEWAKCHAFAQEYYELSNGNFWDGEGCFCDSYINDSVMNSLGLCWFTDILPLIDEDRCIRGENQRRFYTLIANKQDQQPRTAELLELIRTALDLEEPIYCVL